MKKSKLFFMAMALLCMATGFTACSDDDDQNVPNLPTPQYEQVSGKYTMTSTGSPYESIELGASGNYVVTLNYGGYSAPAAYADNGTTRAAKGKRLSMLNIGKANAQTRATQYGNVIYGTFTDMGDNEYNLEGFGTIRLDYSGSSVTGIEVTPQGGQTTQYNVEKAPVMGDDDMTNALCRTWKIERIHEIYVDKETGERFEGDFYPENPGEDAQDMPKEMMVSKSGTYIVSYLDGTFMLAVWKWQNREAGVLAYGYDGEWSDDTAQITFNGNNAVMYEEWDDEYETDQIWTYLVAE